MSIGTKRERKTDTHLGMPGDELDHLFEQQLLDGRVVVGVLLEFLLRNSEFVMVHHHVDALFTRWIQHMCMSRTKKKNEEKKTKNYVYERHFEGTGKTRGEGGVARGEWHTACFSAGGRVPEVLCD